MTTKWVVTTASERVALDETTRGGEATFMVTNQSPKSARAMFDIKTGAGVDESWFSVEDPQRPIRPAASVPYLVRIQVPQQVPPGQYEFEARVYPPDSAPEENFVLSRRVMLEVPKPPAPPKKKFPWWIVVAAALLVLVIGVVTWIAWPSGTPAAAPSPSPSPSVSAAPVEYVNTPQVLKLSIEDARTTLAKAGLQVGTVRYTFGGSVNVTRQSVPPGTFIPKGTKVDLEMQAPYSAPTVTAPANKASIPAGQWPTVTWTQPESYATKWRVWIQADVCTKASTTAVPTCTTPVVAGPYMVTGKEFTGPMPNLDLTPTVGTPYHSGRILMTIAAADDYGTQAPAPAILEFTLGH